MKIIIEKRQEILNDVAGETEFKVSFKDMASFSYLSLSDLTELRDKINEILK